MSELTRAVSAEQEKRAISETQDHYATVVQQISELERENSEARIRIIAAQEAIRTEREGIHLRDEEKRRLNRRRRVFATASHQLKMIDEGL